MKQVTTLVMLLLLSTAITSCGEGKRNKAPAPKVLVLPAGADIITTEDSPEIKGEIEVGAEYFISALTLNVRSEDAVSDNVLGILNRNDKVKVTDATVDINGDYVEIVIVKSKNTIKDSEKFYVSYKYLSSTELKEPKYQGKYYVIQNIATEVLRVYKRTCIEKNCKNRMILESEMVAGEDQEGVRTWLGSFKLLHWKKFYQDHRGLYPSWFHPNYPMPPKKSKGALTWLKKKYMPIINEEPKGEMRGAFGWYTGFVGPNSNYQWTHGTIGWGESSIDMIKRTKKILANLVADPRSHGCSRVDNMTISYLREILPAGTRFLKVYAIERLQDDNLEEYSKDDEKSWEWMLTKKDSQKVNGETADREKIENRGVSEDEILDQGTYELDVYPTVIKFKEKSEFTRKIGKKGNVYGVEKSKMKGVFYIDTGLMRDYKHPKHESISVGGIKDEIIPEFIDLMNLDR